MSTTHIGKLAEDLAVKFLQGKGYSIIERNFRNRFCEIDIVAIDKNQIVFVEVKYRRSNTFGEPEHAITKEKLFRMSRAIKFFLNENHKYQDFQMRLDVISILGDLHSAKINHLRNCSI